MLALLGLPSCFARNCLLMLHDLGTEGVGFHFCCSEGAKKFRVTSLGGMCLRQQTFWPALLVSLKFQ
jgi:hypothetical protein